MSSSSGRGAALVERLGLHVVRREGANLRCACDKCGSSDNLSIHEDGGYFSCYSCTGDDSKGGALKLATRYRDPASARELLIEIGIFEPNHSCNGQHAHSTAEPFSISGEEYSTAALAIDNRPASKSAELTDALEAVARARGLTAEGLRAYGAVPPDAYTTHAVRLPVFDGEGKQCSYFNLGIEGKGVFAAGRPAGVFLPCKRVGANEFEAVLPRPGEKWLACEGCKDAIALWQLGYRVIGLNTCRMNKKFAPLVNGVDITIVGDLDTAGLNGLQETAANSRDHAASIRIAKLPGEVQRKSGNDTRDTLKLAGGEALVRKAIESASLWQADGEVRAVEPGTRVRPTDRNNYGTVVADGGATCSVHFVSPDGSEATKEFAKSDLMTADGRSLDTTIEAAPAAMPINIAELIESHPRLAEPVIDGVLRRGETANFVSLPKIGKSWLSYDLALSTAAGRKWLGHFSCTAGRVLLVDNELSPSVIAHRIPIVADAIGLQLSDYQDNLDVLALRGRLTDFYALGAIIDRLEQGAYVLTIADAFYRFLPPGTNENDNGAVAALYNLLDCYSARLNSGWVNIHHASKGEQSSKGITDVGAGAGAQSRAADAHIILRPHEEDGAVVLEAAVRSFPPVAPLPLRWTFPIWSRAGELDPGAIKGRKNGNDARNAASNREGIEKIHQALLKGPAVRREIMRRTGGMNRERCQRLLDSMEANGRVSATTTKSGGKDTLLYELSVEPSDAESP